VSCCRCFCWEGEGGGSHASHISPCICCRCDTNETEETLDTILSLQPRTGGGSGGAAREGTIAAVSRDIAARLPAPFDVEAISMAYPVLYAESMNTVLVQECIRYNRLLDIMRSSLGDIQKALTGLVVMSKDLDDMGTALFGNKVPALWEARAYPSLKPLAAWVADLVERLEFIAGWVGAGPPPVFWISGFFCPQAFLSGIMQNYARSHTLPIDTLSWDFVYLNHRPAEAITAKPTDGCFIRGLFLEGARYDETKGLLAESLPKQLYTPLPVMHLVPVQHRVPPTTHVYRCPVYKILSRWGVLATTGHSSNFVLFIEIPSDRPDIINNTGEADIGVWVRAGVAAFTSLKF
jgi:dynein heavy chain